MSSPRARTAPSIRAIAALFVVIPVVVVSAVLVVLLTATARRTGEALGAQMLDNAAAMVAGDVGEYLGEAMRVSDLYAMRLREGTLPATDLGAWERPLFEDLVTTPGVASICYGSADGRAVYLQRANGRMEFGLGEGPGVDQCREFEVTPEGRRGHEPLRVYQYVPTERPWYRAAADTGSAVWTPIYFWFATQRGDAETGTGYARPILAADGVIAGVLTIDVTLSALSDFLRRIPVGEGAALFLIDEQGRLVAATDGAVTGADGERVPLGNSPSPAARAAHGVIQQTGTGPASAAASGTAARGAGHASGQARIGREPVRIVATPLSPLPGLHWRLVAVVPEAVFMSDARAAQGRSLMVAVVAVIGSALLALRFADRLAHPIMALRTHMKRLARGEFDIPLDLRAARELQDLSRDLNAAAADLKSHVEIRHSLELAMQVQQSLLPSEPPKPPGLDLAGKSTYCDETGGDYFDFIEVIDVPVTEAASAGEGSPGPGGSARRATLIVVGDVMGHGVAAALLMATARATLRLRARRPASLGQILTDVNSVLAPDFRNGRFMTMALLLIDPERRIARWASAGHDAPIVYEPRKGAFRTLDGGDFPLGVVEGTEYREYELTDLEPGSVLAIGTDGIWEAVRAGGEAFGHERLRALVRENASGPAARIAAAIDRSLAEFLGRSRAKDDVTYAIARLEEPPSSAPGR